MDYEELAELADENPEAFRAFMLDRGSDYGVTTKKKVGRKPGSISRGTTNVGTKDGSPPKSGSYNWKWVASDVDSVSITEVFISGIGIALPLFLRGPVKRRIRDFLVDNVYIRSVGIDGTIYENELTQTEFNDATYSADIISSALGALVGIFLGAGGYRLIKNPDPRLRVPGYAMVQFAVPFALTYGLMFLFSDTGEDDYVGYRNKLINQGKLSGNLLTEEAEYNYSPTSAFVTSMSNLDSTSQGLVIVGIPLVVIAVIILSAMYIRRKGNKTKLSGKMLSDLMD